MLMVSMEPSGKMQHRSLLGAARRSKSTTPPDGVRKCCYRLITAVLLMNVEAAVLITLVQRTFLHAQVIWVPRSSYRHFESCHTGFSLQGARVLFADLRQEAHVGWSRPAARWRHTNKYLFDHFSGGQICQFHGSCEHVILTQDRIISTSYVSVF